MTLTARKKPGPRSKRPPTKELFDLYEDHTAAEIAQKYGVSLSTVRTWIRTLRRAPETGGAG